MALFGGGSAQSSVVNQANIDYSPFFNFGNDNTPTIDKTFNPAATLTPKLDESTTASVGVGVAGGSGTGGEVKKSEDPYTEIAQPFQEQSRGFSPGQIEKFVPLVIYGTFGIGGVIILKTILDNNKRKKKK